MPTPRSSHGLRPEPRLAWPVEAPAAPRLSGRRVALFSGNYNYIRDGANQALNRLVDHLERVAGVEVRVYSPTTDAPAFEPCGTLVSVPSFAFPGRGEYRIARGLPRKVRQDLDGFAPDLIHVSAPDVLGTRAVTYGRERGLPVVASLHTRFETYFDYYGLGWINPLIRAHLRRFYGRCDLVLAPTPAIVAEMAEGRPQGSVQLWSRGVDRALFDPARRNLAWRRGMGIADDEITLLFFGRLVIEKGVRAYLDVVEQVRARGARVRPLVIGDGPARQAFESLPGAVLTGHLSGEALGTAVAGADIVLNPSATEAFGNVVLEAMAAGLAIVAADVASARSLVSDAATGLLRPIDANALSEAVMELVRDEAKRRRLGAAARAASARFSWAAACDSVVDNYLHALASGDEERS